MGVAAIGNPGLKPWNHEKTVKTCKIPSAKPLIFKLRVELIGDIQKPRMLFAQLLRHGLHGGLSQDRVKNGLPTVSYPRILVPLVAAEILIGGPSLASKLSNPW